MFLLKTFLLSCLIILYILEKTFLPLSFTSHFKNCFKITGKQKIIMSQKGEYVKFKNYERKIKLPFITYADFWSILVPEDNG